MEQTTSSELLRWINDLNGRASAGDDVRHAALLVQLEILNGIYRQLEILVERQTIGRYP